MKNILENYGTIIYETVNTNVINVKSYGALGDGVTNDSTAVTQAFNASQSQNKPLYFPAGTYFLNYLNLTANENLEIFGEGTTIKGIMRDGDTILLGELVEADIITGMNKSELKNPGRFYSYKDTKIHDINIFKKTTTNPGENDFFLWLRPDGFQNLYVNKVKFYNNEQYNDNIRFVFSRTTTEQESTNGFNYIEITNNDISKCSFGFRMESRIKSGIILNNIIHNLGNPGTYSSASGMLLGMTNDPYPAHGASDIFIENNKFYNSCF